MKRKWENMKSYVPPDIRNREARRRRLRFFCFIFVACVLIAGGVYGLFFNPALRIRQVFVSGADQPVSDEINTLLQKNIFRVLPGNNLLFVRADNFSPILERYSTIKNIVLRKEYRNAALYVDVSMRIPAGVWCGDWNECFLFDEAGVIYTQLEEMVASSSFPIVVEETRQLPKTLSFLGGGDFVDRKLLDVVVKPEELQRFKHLIMLFGEHNMSVDRILRPNGAYRDVIFETKRGGFILVNIARSTEETERDFLLIREKIPSVDFAYIDLRIPGRIYYR